jgi:hypothetical protein
LKSSWYRAIKVDSVTFSVKVSWSDTAITYTWVTVNDIADFAQLTNR